MYILGISAFYHDSAACLLKDGEIVAAAQEERFTRKKHDAGFPHYSSLYCLKEAGIAAKDIENVVFYENSHFCKINEHGKNTVHLFWNIQNHVQSLKHMQKNPKYVLHGCCVIVASLCITPKYFRKS